MYSLRILEELAAYLPHYLQIGGIILMLASAFAAVFICVCILTAYGRKSVSDDHVDPQTAEEMRRFNVRSLTERYFELVFSGTIFLLFTAGYFMITYFGVGGGIWNRYSSYVLIGLILVAVLVNAWFDKKLIPLQTLRPGERECMHLLAIVYMLVIFAYIKFAYENDNYDSIIQYFILLFIGRFIGFDTSIGGVSKNIKMAFRNLPLLFMALGSTGLMALVGFGSGYLIVANGVVWNLFLGQMYLVIIMFIVHRLSGRFRKRM